MTPPRLAEWLLSRRFAGDERDEILGDLQEQFGRRVPTDGPRGARRWYWVQTFVLMWGLGTAHRDQLPLALDERGGAWMMAGVVTDVKMGWRSLRHSPSFAWIAWLTLTFGIGLSAAVFSLVRSTLLQPLPYADPARIVRIIELPPGQESPVGDGVVSDTAIGLWLSRARSLDAVSPYTTSRLVLGLPGGPTTSVVADVGGPFFSVLSAPPLLGRSLDSSDAIRGAAPVVVISRHLWKTAYAERPDITAATIDVDGTACAIAGVLPASFTWPGGDVDVWRIGPDYQHDWPSPGGRRMFTTAFGLVGRLSPSASLEDAQADGAVIAGQIAAADPLFATGTAKPPQMRVRRLLDDMVAPVRPALVLLSLGMGLVLATGCINLASLLLARHTARQRDLALRIALGASRWRVIRPVALELLLLGAAGTASGGVLAAAIIRVIPLAAPHDLPRLDAVRFDAGTVFAIAAGAVLTVLAVGLALVVRTPRQDMRSALASTARLRFGPLVQSGDRIRAGLVAAQVALAVTLLVMALLVGRSFWTLIHVNSGYQPDGVVTFQVSLPHDVLGQPGRQRSYYLDFVDALQHHPGVRSAGYALALPMRTISFRQSVAVEGRPLEPQTFDPSQMAVTIAVSMDYLSTLGTAVVRGRGFTASDTTYAEKVILIDETLGHRYFPNQNPLGLRLRGPGRQLWKIVGVVEPVRLGRLDVSAEPTIYFHEAQLPEVLAYGVGSGMAVRTGDDPRNLAPFIQSAAHALNPAAPVHDIRPLTDQLNESVARPRFMALVLALFALLALATALLGIYGVLTYSVERQQLELGIRRALGATERHIVALVAKRGAALAGGGLLVGSGMALGAARLLRRELFGISPADPIALSTAFVLIVVTVIAASWQPVRRALRADPASTLRLD